MKIEVTHIESSFMDEQSEEEEEEEIFESAKDHQSPIPPIQ